jgi:hypothetical protein
MLDSKVTIFKDILTKAPTYITLEKALERIKTGRSKELVEQIRETKNEELKKKLPCICFSGVFSPTRTDENLKEHSGFIVLDFDKLYDSIDEVFETISNHPSVFAVWVSPSGVGLKALLRISDVTAHRQHFNAIRKEYPILDASGINVSRVCFESYDPNLYINYSAVPYTSVFEEVVVKEVIRESKEIIERLLVWLKNKNIAFTSGNRNKFIFNFATAACCFGVNESEFLYYAQSNYAQSDFTSREIKTSVDSAYKKNIFGSAKFEKNVLISKESNKECVLSEPDSKDIILVSDVKAELKELFKHGHPDINGVGIDELDRVFKPKRGEVTLITGYGNHGKSQFLRWYLLFRALKLGEKFCFFAPEDAPTHEFYFACTEMLLGCNLLPSNVNRPSEDLFEIAQEFIGKHFFFVYPSDISPSPTYIKSKFLQVILEQGVSGVIIDPFNQLSNDYSSAGGRSDKYLETFLADYAKFARDNKIYGFIVAHPKTPKKDKDGTYPEPTPFDVADGTMWNNKIDDILVYHRPDYWTDMNSSTCNLRSAKVRRQWKAQRDIIEFNYSRIKRRFIFEGFDFMQTAIKKLGLFEDYTEIEDVMKPKDLVRLPELVVQSELF